MPATKRKPIRARGRQTARSGVHSVRLSGYDLVPTRKRTGKPATTHDYAKVAWKPWPRDPSGRLYPDAEQMDAIGVGARMAHGVMLQSHA